MTRLPIGALIRGVEELKLENEHKTKRVKSAAHGGWVSETSVDGSRRILSAVETARPVSRIEMMDTVFRNDTARGGSYFCYMLRCYPPERMASRTNSSRARHRRRVSEATSSAEGQAGWRGGGGDAAQGLASTERSEDDTVVAGAEPAAGEQQRPSRAEAAEALVRAHLSAPIRGTHAARCRPR